MFAEPKGPESYCFERFAAKCELNEAIQYEIAVAKQPVMRIVSSNLHGLSLGALSSGVVHCPSWMHVFQVKSHLMVPSPGSQRLLKLTSCLNE